jgi:hypothetical protein
MKRNNNVWFSLLHHLLWMICSAHNAAIAFVADNEFALVGRSRNPPTDIGRFPKVRPGTKQQKQRQRNNQNHARCYGWLEDFFEPNKSSTTASKQNARELQYPEQYPATYEQNEYELEEDSAVPEALLVRGLLKNTQLQSRPLQLVYDANKDGWDPVSFHNAVDGKGASVVLVKDKNGRICGGYNPKGHASLGGARPSVAAFLFYQRNDNDNAGVPPVKFQKLRKVGGGGLACARDDPDFGISFGPDALVIGLQNQGTAGRERLAASKLGPYFEKGPEDLPSLFSYSGGGDMELSELKVLVGCYEAGEDIPYFGGVLDMTSG